LLGGGRVYSSVFNPRRTDLPFSSQLAVWAVERIFRCWALPTDGAGDFSAQRLPAFRIRSITCAVAKVVSVLIGVVLLLTGSAIVIRRSGDAVADGGTKV